MLDEQEISTFARLFKGRMDAYGTEEGSCERVPQWTWPTYLEKISGHIDGTAPPIGVFPMCPDSEREWVTYWGCVDFDEGEERSLIHAQNLSTVLDACEITCWIERSRSKGYHVWVFCEEAVDVARMRHALLAACDLARAPIKEINPKSEGFYQFDESGTKRPDWSKVGNYVRLPYPHGWEANHRRCMVDIEGYPIPLKTFIAVAYPSRCTDADLDMLVNMYHPIQTHAEFRPVDVTTTLDSGLPSTDKLNARAYKTWLEGPFDGRDRSSALWKLANEIYKSGYSYEHAVLLVNDADKRWGKHHQRGDEDRLVKMLAKVYQHV